jgi:hypothetical protein
MADDKTKIRSAGFQPDQRASGQRRLHSQRTARRHPDRPGARRLHESYEVNQLKAAVAKVGVSAAAVEKELARR